MDNQEIFDELTQLVRQPAIWLTARSLYGWQTQKPDNSRRLLRILAETQNDLTAGAIADILAVRPASVTQIIKKLEADDYVERVKDENDARVTRVKITAAGREQLKKLDENRSDFQSEIFDIFTDEEREQFGESLRKLNEHVSSDAFVQKITHKLSKHEQHMVQHLLGSQWQKVRDRQDDQFAKALEQRRNRMERYGKGRNDNGWF